MSSDPNHEAAVPGRSHRSFPSFCCPASALRRRRVRHHVNPLKEGFLGLAAEPIPLGERPIEVELGCADALFLFERARLRAAAGDRGGLYLGLEIRDEMVRRVNRKAHLLGLSQVRAVFANINFDLRTLFPVAGTIDRIFINFPDPWFKRAQQKRRLVTPELALLLTDLLVPGGELFFQSDVFDLALDAMAVLEQAPGLRNDRGEWSFARDNPYGAASLREVRVLERGLPVWRMCYLRQATCAATCR